MDQSFHGRGATENPANRFERLHYEMEPDEGARDETPAPPTVFFKDATRSIIATNDSPDVGFAASINPYTKVGAAAVGVKRCNRPLSAHRAPTEADTRMPGSISTVSQSRGHYHQKPLGHS
jgi:hypothetical protein